MTLAGGEYTVFCRSISNNDWTLIGILPRVLLESDNRELFSMLVTGGLIAVFCAIIYMIISAYIVKPLRVISIALGRIEAGETARSKSQVMNWANQLTDKLYVRPNWHTTRRVGRLSTETARRTLSGASGDKPTLRD